MTVHYIQVYQQNISVGILMTIGIVPLPQAMFMVFIIYWYTDEICSSIYSNGYENCSFLNMLIINVLLTDQFFPNGIVNWMKRVCNIWRAF
jgi:hypothetical protein